MARAGLALFIALLLGVASVGSPPPTPHFTFQTLPLDGGTINDQGWVAGVIVPDPRRHLSATLTFRESRLGLWRDGHLRSLGQFPGYHGISATAINNRGEIVGTAGGENGASQLVYLWNGHRMICLLHPGSGFPEPSAINVHGDVVGTVMVGPVTPSSVQKGFVYRNGTVRLIADPMGGNMCAITDINNSGEMVGFATDPHAKGPDGTQAVRLVEWRQGKVEVIRTPSDIEFGRFQTDPKLNRRGDIIFDGYQIGVPNVLRGFLLRSGKLTEIGPIPGYPMTSLRGINDQGEVVGSCSRLNPEIPGKPSPPTVYRSGPSFLWKDGKVIQLQNVIDKGYVIPEVIAINNRGQILGRGWHGYFLLNPVAAATK